MSLTQQKPDVSEAADFSKKMTLQEKLDFIDGEIRKIHVFCTKSGYSATQIEQFAKPFFEKENNSIGSTIWVSGKAWKRRVVALITMVVATVFLFRYDPAYQLASALSKQGAIQILPLWDWTQIYHSRCWFENPLYTPSGLQLSDCEVCEAFDAITKIKDVTGEHLFEEYIHTDLPVIIKDGAKDWLETKNISIRTLAEMYQGNLGQYESCHWSSNLKNLDHRQLLKMFMNKKIDKFYAQWQNCHHSAAKTFRALYQRPYFLPPSVALLSTSWISVSSNYSSKLFKQVDMSYELVLYIQVKGQSLVRLQLEDACYDICTSFEEILQEGEILITTNYLWKLLYKPGVRDENIAVVLAGRVDH
ncbi:hypothetical protein Bpfe_010769 [Biomphalaria pfeifferi]|uniref:Uncharacterized protein n=1 Tax=Biomphalaria pfeifferi TaxID=112525 RepID=A0AAD8BU64_BIOPF|nr:hypothetical protein Bpfe_010769 [Biomphalaria pfeifferi]